VTGLLFSPESRSSREIWGWRMARFAVPDGWTAQAFQFALDCTPEQEACLRRQFRGRRYARNWAVRTIREDVARYREVRECRTLGPSKRR
jgi:hypothetical protein